MRLDEYRTYLDGLDLTDSEMQELQEALTAIVSSIVDSLFKGVHENDNQQ